MKTDSINRARKAHHDALSALYAEQTPNPPDGLTLWRKLVRVEREVSRLMLAYCNAEIDTEAADRAATKAKAKVKQIFGGILPDGFFVNRDPRGYALKIDNDQRPIPEGLEKDWGGYGILAPTIA